MLRSLNSNECIFKIAIHHCQKRDGCHNHSILAMATRSRICDHSTGLNWI